MDCMELSGDSGGGVPVETDPTRAIEWMTGLPVVRFPGVEDGEGGVARIHVETRAVAAGCPACGVIAREGPLPHQAGRPAVVRPADPPRLAQAPAGVRGHRLPEGTVDRRGPPHRRPRQVLTARAARWATLQVGRRGRRVNEVAHELGCDWHTVNDTVVSYGDALPEADTERIGEVTALGLDEVLMVRVGPYHRQHFTTQLVDVRRGQLLERGR